MPAHLNKKRYLFFLAGVIGLGTIAAFGGWMLRRPPEITLHEHGDFSVSKAPIDIYPLNLPGDDLRLYWKDTEGKPYESAERLDAALREQGLRVAFATNSGIYMESPQGVRPLGLHVEDGEVLVPLNTVENEYGNFYMQPNGVFLLEANGQTDIVLTKDYAARTDTPRFALQSGPMLVMNGKVNPSFGEDSKNVDLRAGIGVNDEGRAWIAVSTEPVSLHAFASALIEAGSKRALYLDGGIVSVWAPAHGTRIKGGKMAGILAVVEAADP